ncbi:hypothetical protein [Paenibacillus sp. BAC0078]
MEEWSNRVCLGYIIAGLERKGWSEDQIRQVVGAVYREFDFITVEEAKDKYNKSYY